MKIGYPCINLSIGCKSDKTFRIKSYSEERLILTIENNLTCLERILQYNLHNNILFFRITSDLIPFASHPICTFNWQEYFKQYFQQIGNFIKKHNMRISTHPDQFILLNSIQQEVFINSRRELLYHTRMLDLMGLDTTAKIQIHVGGIYNNKIESIKRFIQRYNALETEIKSRLVIENDDRLYNWSDCISIYQETGIPIIFDAFHHQINNDGSTLDTIFKSLHKIWKGSDGIPMIDYSQPRDNVNIRYHSDSLNTDEFAKFLLYTIDFDFDIMLEIKDKEKSAIKAIEIARNDPRFINLQKTDHLH